MLTHRTLGTLPLAILCMFSALSTFATAATAADTPAALRTAAATGQIDLGKIQAFSATPLRSVTIERPEVTADGEVFGVATLGSSSCRVALHAVSAGLNGENSAWVLALDLTVGRLSEVIPPLEGTVADGFSVGRSALVLSTATVRIDETSLSRRVAEFYQQYFDSPRMLMEFASGVNCLARADSAQRSPLAKTLQLLGVDGHGLLLQGCVLKDATYGELKEAKKNAQLRERLRESMELRAYLPPIEIAGLPANYETGEGSLVVSGKPGVGVAFRLVAPGATTASTQTFECRVDVSAADLGATEIKVMATAQGVWQHALGIQGFDLIDARLLLSVDNQQKVGFGVRAGLQIGSKQMAVAAKLQLHAVTGFPLGGLFEGSLNSLSSDDLIKFVNHMAGATKKKRLSGDAIPPLELRDLSLKFAPGAGDSDLGVSDGFALRGELHALGRKFAFVDGELSTSGVLPEIAIRGACGDVDLGALALKGAAVDIKIGVSSDQHFRLKGETQLLARRRHVDVNVGVKNLYFDTWEELGGVYRTEYHLSSPAAGKPTWNLRAAFRNDFSKTLEREVSQRALAWAKKTEKNFAQAQRNLNTALTKVRNLDRKIDATKAEIQAKRAVHQKNLNAARKKVASIQQGIDKLRASIQGKRNARKKTVNAKRKAMNAAHTAWKKAKKARQQAKPWKRAKLRAAEAKKLVSYKGKQVAYKTADAAYKSSVKLPIDADARIVALFASKKTADAALVVAKKLVSTVPVETDPRVVALFTARHTAAGALHVAKGAVTASEKATQGAAKVTAWAARNNGKLLMLDSASFAAQLAGYLRGNKVTFKSAVRFVGKAHKINLRLHPGRFRPKDVFDNLWSELQATL